MSIRKAVLKPRSSCTYTLYSTIDDDTCHSIIQVDTVEAPGHPDFRDFWAQSIHKAEIVLRNDLMCASMASSTVTAQYDSMKKADEVSFPSMLDEENWKQVLSLVSN